MELRTSIMCNSHYSHSSAVDLSLIHLLLFYSIVLITLHNLNLHVTIVPVQSALRELTSRDSFCAPEIDIFRAIQQWAERNTDQQLTTSAMSTVRLPLIKLDDLLNVVRLSSLVSADAILDAIKLKNECKDMELNYRGFLSLYRSCLCCVHLHRKYCAYWNRIDNGDDSILML